MSILCLTVFEISYYSIWSIVGILTIIEFAKRFGDTKNGKNE